jgi:hypothetical protein
MKILTTEQLIQELKGRKYKRSQIHHTWRPAHKDFDGKNHLKLQLGMRTYHVSVRKFDDIAQHVTLFPDGLWVTGRDFDKAPAGITGFNSGSFMVEMLGDFDKGKDKLEGAQLESMIHLQHFLVTECGAEIIFHREKANKSCPGSGIDKGAFLTLIANYKGTEAKIGGNTVYLNKGDRGKEVQVLQEKLVALDFDIVVDGIFGDKTDEAVRTFQQRSGLKVDGIVGPNTIAKMSVLLDKPVVKESLEITLGGKKYRIIEA